MLPRIAFCAMIALLVQPFQNHPPSQTQPTAQEVVVTDRIRFVDRDDPTRTNAEIVGAQNQLEFVLLGTDGTPKARMRFSRKEFQDPDLSPEIYLEIIEGSRIRRLEATFGREAGLMISGASGNSGLGTIRGPRAK